MRGITSTMAILSLLVITVTLAGTSYILLSNTFNFYSDNVKHLSPTIPVSCNADIRIDDVCFTNDKIRVTISNLKNSKITTNSQIIVEGNFFIALIPFNPPNVDLGDTIVVEIDYKPNVLGNIQRVSIEPKIETENGETVCNTVGYLIEERKQC